MGQCQQKQVNLIKQIIKHQLADTKANRANRILYLFANGDKDEAFIQIQKWQRQHWNNPEIYKLKAHMFEKIQRYQESINCYRLAIRLDHYDHNSSYQLSRLLIDHKKEYKEAEAILLGLMKYEKKQTQSLLAHLYHQSGKLFLSIDILIQSLEYFPENVNIHYSVMNNLQIIKFQLEQYNEQIEYKIQQKSTIDLPTIFVGKAQSNIKEDKILEQYSKNFIKDKNRKNITNLQQYPEYQKAILQKLKQSTQNPYILYIINTFKSDIEANDKGRQQQPSQQLIKSINLICQNDENYENYQKYYNPTLNKYFQQFKQEEDQLIQLLYLINYYWNSQMRQVYMLRLMRFYQNQQISNLKNYKIRKSQFQLPTYLSRKSKINILKMHFRDFIEKKRDKANFILNFIQNQFKYSVVQLNIAEDVFSSALSFFMTLKQVLQPIHKMQSNSIIKHINLQKIYKLKASNVDQLLKQKCIIIFAQQGQKEDFKLSKEQFFKKTVIKIRVGMKFWMKTGKLQKIHQKLMIFLLNFQELSTKEVNSCKKILKGIYKEQQNLTNYILEKLQGYLENKKQNEVVLKQIAKQICDSVYYYSQQKYLYNQLIKFIIDQYGLLVERCLPNNISNFIRILQHFKQDKSIHQLIHNFQMQFSESVNSEIQTNYMGYNSKPKLNNLKQIGQNKVIEYLPQFEEISSLSKAIDSRMDDFSGMDQLNSDKYVSDIWFETQKSYSKDYSESALFKSSIDSQSRQSNRLVKDIIGEFIFDQDIANIKVQSQEFRKIFTENHFSILQYISSNPKIFIAEHNILKNSIKIQQSWIKSFNYSVAQGQRQFSQIYSKNKYKDELALLTSLGTRTIYCWLISAAYIIRTLQQLGIYQADFQIRNTIKFGDIFQAIDFDYALTLSPNYIEGKESFDCAMKILEYWLYNDNDDVDLRMEQIYLRISNQITDKIISLKAKIRKQPHSQSKETILNQCLCLFKQHMKISHFAQLKKIWSQIQLSMVLAHKQSIIIQQLFLELWYDKDYIKFSKQIGDLYASNHCNEDVLPILRNRSQKKKEINNFSSISDYHIKSQQYLKKNIEYLQLKYVYSSSTMILSNNSENIINSYSKATNLQKIVQIGKSHVYSFMASLSKIFYELQHNGLWISDLNIEMLIRVGEVYKIELENVNISQIQPNPRVRKIQQSESQLYIAKICKMMLKSQFDLQRQKQSSQIWRYIFPIFDESFIKKTTQQMSRLSHEDGCLEIFKHLMKQKILENHRSMIVKLLYNLLEAADIHYSIESNQRNQIQLCISSLQLSKEMKDYKIFARQIEDLYFSNYSSQQKSYY